jgi:hypothetical protein
MMLIALLLIQVVALTGCYETTRLSETYSSTREGPVSNPGVRDIDEPGRRLLLVMVHGFSSSSNQGWGEFPRIIKSEKDTAFSGFNVLRYEYGSTICRNNADISDRGDGLKSFLSDDLKNYDGMIIMGHSLGGLVAMHGLINLAKAHHPSLKRIPVTVMTFGTPHLGVEGAERLGYLGFLCTDKQAKDVEVFNRSSRELRKDWDSYFGGNEYRVTIRTFYGSDDTFVSQDSACGRFTECEQINPVNHVMIVKPSDTNHLAYKKLRVQADSMKDLIYGEASAKSSPPITEPRMPDGRTKLLKTCGPSPLTQRPAEAFVGRWVSQLNLLYSARNEPYRDIENLRRVQGRGLVADAGIDLHSEIMFTLSCLEKMGYLKLEKYDPPRMHEGKENMKIIFSEPMMPIPY